MGGVLVHQDKTAVGFKNDVKLADDPDVTERNGKERRGF